MPEQEQWQDSIRHARDLLGEMPVTEKGVGDAGEDFRPYCRSDICERREGREDLVGNIPDCSTI